MFIVEFLRFCLGLSRAVEALWKKLKLYTRKDN
jgi:hypothetical protein